MNIIKAVTKNTKVLDSFTIYFFNDTYLSLSHNCDSPQGISQWGEGCSFSNGELDLAGQTDLKVSKEEILINFFDLPVNVQEHAIRRIESMKELY